jgi:hypothetical protein
MIVVFNQCNTLVSGPMFSQKASTRPKGFAGSVCDLTQLRIPRQSLFQNQSKVFYFCGQLFGITKKILSLKTLFGKKYYYSFALVDRQVYPVTPPLYQSQDCLQYL